LDIVVRKMRRKDAQEALTRIDRLITMGKWVGIGGLAAIEAGFISPPAGALFTVHVAYPAFVMIDP
jgi:hypothetical protein